MAEWIYYARSQRDADILIGLQEIAQPYTVEGRTEEEGRVWRKLYLEFNDRNPETVRVLFKRGKTGLVALIPEKPEPVEQRVERSCPRYIDLNPLESWFVDSVVESEGNLGHGEKERLLLQCFAKRYGPGAEFDLEKFPDPDAREKIVRVYFISRERQYRSAINWRSKQL
ncbi:hypothetical protein HOC80_00620 [archaeon]|jgi:hypothetical protein|nr:hypothetical protein [archaeon]MBT4416589.1 hypothetical protein [archaeon]